MEPLNQQNQHLGILNPKPLERYWGKSRLAETDLAAPLPKAHCSEHCRYWENGKENGNYYLGLRVYRV